MQLDKVVVDDIDALRRENDLLKSQLEQLSKNQSIPMEKKYSRLFKEMQSGFILAQIDINKEKKTIDFLVQDYNKAIIDVFAPEGYNFINASISDMLDLPDPIFVDRLVHVINTGDSFKYETYSQLVKKYIELSVFQFSETVIAVICNDITNRKLWEEQIVQKSNLLREAQNLANLGVWEYFSDANEFYFSEEARRILDFDPNRTISLRYFISQINNFDVQHVLKCLRSGVRDFEFRLKPKHGEIREIHITYFLEVESERNNHRFYGIAQDITQLRKTQYSLELNESRLRQASQLAKLGYWEYYIDEDVQILSDESQNMLEAHSSKIRQNEFYKKLTSRDKSRFKRIFKSSVERQQFFELEFQILNSNGEQRFIQARGEHIFNNQNKHYRTIGSYLDITHQKKVERELVKAKEKAEESDMLKSTFLANMSHEIRTPLNGILGFSQLLTMPNIDNTKKEKFIHFIDINAKQLLVIISDIIDIAKIESGQIKIFKKEVSVYDTLRSAYEGNMVQLATFPEKNVKLILKANKDKNLNVFTDQSRFKQILDNLINNAIKFTQNGFIVFGYRFHKKGSILFYVQDTGIGIDVKDQEYIFDQFRQVDESETREYGGTGLGLAITKNLVELLGGKIWVESTKGEGAIFYFTLPIEDEFSETLTECEDYESYENMPEWTGKTIMIVDDVEFVYEHISALLEPTGVKCLYYNSGIKAEKAINSNLEVDLILMDIQMPEQGGTETKNKIKRKRPNVPVIAQTANALAEDRKKYLDLGFDEYVPKPIERFDLFAKIGKLIDGKDITDCN